MSQPEPAANTKSSPGEPLVENLLDKEINDLITKAFMGDETAVAERVERDAETGQVAIVTDIVPPLNLSQLGEDGELLEQQEGQASAAVESDGDDASSDKTEVEIIVHNQRPSEIFGDVSIVKMFGISAAVLVFLKIITGK